MCTAPLAGLWRPLPVPVSRWAWAAFLTAFAVLVKGPFGLLPLFATTLARAVALRSPREIWLGGLSAVAAVLPVVAFLGCDKWFGAGTWWNGYVIDQLYASALGLRNDGEPGLVPLRTLAGRFWPGLPLAAWGIAVGLRDLVRRLPNAVSIAALHSLATIALVCVPSRKIWHHALVAYPALAVVAGAAPLVERIVASPDRARKAAIALATVAAILMIASAAGAGIWLAPRACVAPSALARSLPPKSDVLVVAPWIDWRALAALAAEHHLVPWPAVSFAGDVPLIAGSGVLSPGHRALAALVRDDAAPAPHPGWRKLRREGQWTLWTRQQ